MTDRSVLFGVDNETRYEMIRRKLDVRDLLDSLGLEEVEDRGDELFALCPFHNDTNPSWSINVDEDGEYWGVHSCFVCKEEGHRKGRGNVVSLVRDLTSLDSYEKALSWLEQYVGIGNSIEDLYELILDTRMRDKIDPKPKTSNAPSRLYSSFKPVKSGDPYWRYLTGRGVLPWQIEARGARIGKGGKDGRYNNCVAVPIRKGTGVVNFFARAIGKAKKKVIYGPGKGTISSTLYGYEFADRMEDTAYISEGGWDVMAIERALRLLGWPSENVFGTLGAVLLEEQAKLLRFWRRVVVVPDMKGKAKSILPSAKTLLRDHELQLVELPKGTDADDHDDEDLAEHLEAQCNARRSVVRVKVDYEIRR